MKPPKLDFSVQPWGFTLPAKIFGGGGFLLMDILGAEKSGVNFLN